MKINEITEALGPGYSDNPQHKKLADIGRKLMDMSASMKITKNTPDSEIDKSNKMASFGDALTRFGTSFGPRNMQELLKTSRVSKEEALEFMKIGQSAPAPKLKGHDVEPEEPEDDDMDAAPDDDEIARQADMMAKGK